MFWLRSAAMYLIITAIFFGALWLFWGKDLEKLWKKAEANPIVKEKISKPLAQKKAELKKIDLPKLSLPAGVAEKLPVDATAEWKKTQSGMMGLVAAQKRENIRDMGVLTSKNDQRMIDILRAVKLYKDVKPAPALLPGSQPVKVAPASKPAKIKSGEQRPSKRRAEL